MKITEPDCQNSLGGVIQEESFSELERVPNAQKDSSRMTIQGKLQTNL
jgi:hypothetical protein